MPNAQNACAQKMDTLKEQRVPQCNALNETAASNLKKCNCRPHACLVRYSCDFFYAQDFKSLQTHPAYAPVYDDANPSL